MFQGFSGLFKRFFCRFFISRFQQWVSCNVNDEKNHNGSNVVSFWLRLKLFLGGRIDSPKETTFEPLGKDTNNVSLEYE